MSNELATIQQEAERMPEFAAICMSIAELETMLLEQNPGMPTYLQRIHRDLLRYPELTHILSDEQRATIIDALMVQTGVLLTETTEKTAKRTNSKKLASMSEEDI